MRELVLDNYTEAKSYINDFVKGFENNAFEYSNAHNPIIPELLKQIFGYKPEFHIFFQDDTVRVIGFISGVTFKNKFISIPHFSCAGFLAKDESLYHEFLSHIKRDFFIRSLSRVSPHISGEKVVSFIPLDKGYEALHTSFKYNIRRQIRVAQEKGVTVKFGRKELLDDFLTIYRKNMCRLGSPALPRHFFEKVVSGWENGEAVIVCAYYEGKPIGCSFLLSYGDVIENCWAGFLVEHNKLFAPYLTYSEMIKYAAEHQYRFFSFGRASKDSGSLAFKKHWNTESKQIYYNYSRQQKESLINSSFLLGLYQRCTTVGINNIIGNIISKYVY